MCTYCVIQHVHLLHYTACAPTALYSMCTYCIIQHVHLLHYTEPPLISATLAVSAGIVETTDITKRIYTASTNAIYCTCSWTRHKICWTNPSYLTLCNFLHSFLTGFSPKISQQNVLSVPSPSYIEFIRSVFSMFIGLT